MPDRQHPSSARRPRPPPGRQRGWPLAAALLRGWLPAVLPSSCALCGAGCAGAVCPACQASYLAAACARCPCCANPVAAHDARRRCAPCLQHRPRFDATVCAADYAAPLDQLVLRLKFGGELALAPWCAQAMLAALRAGGIELPNLLCPVPLGRLRLIGRGYNQALEIARPLARALGIPLFARLAIRAIETEAQSSVAPAARRGNIRNAFVLAPATLAMVRGQHIGVVDDVMTSGATLDELAGLFKRHGAARVTNLVFARTPPH